MGLLTVGQLVTSRMGRDSGRMYVVVGFFDENNVQVADGLLRKMARPKKKNTKHLIAHQAYLRPTQFLDRTIREFIEKHSPKGILGEEGSTEHG